MFFTEHVVDLAQFGSSGAASSQQPSSHIVMQRQGDEALIEGQSGEHPNRSTYFSCFGTEEKLRDLAELLLRKDDTVVLMRSANLQGHSHNRPIKFRCRPGSHSLRLLDIEYSSATDYVHKITLKDLWDRKLPDSQAVEYFARRLNDLLKDF
ncbi:hypothetical protein GCM10010840_33980 [Deinococcus aerolatus]|uniref:Uncharacterized protein n=1 Tax=Deinococcus aerolatus TaxID=522487 RepID=A0ABQ2GF84_9DEIO|nr:hypothetical protein [Deinococcus aerolatus]GGL93141.1 hypothetical protein GCM10010840_33980 [Deinococcus aerolatus]